MIGFSTEFVIAVESITYRPVCDSPCSAFLQVDVKKRVFEINISLRQSKSVPSATSQSGGWYTMIIVQGQVVELTLHQEVLTLLLKA